MEIIENKIQEIIDLGKTKGRTVTKEYAFNVINLHYLALRSNDINKNFESLDDFIPDGANDGGIDFVYFDEDNSKVYIGQSKYSKNIDTNEFVEEFRKILDTLKDFNESNTGKYNSNVKRLLQNALDRLTEESEGNIEIIFASLNDLDDEKCRQRIIDDLDKITDLQIYGSLLLGNEIEKLDSNLEVVKEYRLDIDKANNFTKYETDEKEGLQVNVSSKSLVQLYNAYADNGLFNLNIRRYIRNKSVDEGITHTLNKERSNFWFLNNGLTIACNDYFISGNTIRLYDFSIVNGGQTTTLIGKYKGKSTEEFFIPCKIIMSKKKLSIDESLAFFNSIAEATNSQKPIKPKDLKSNSNEMIQLKQLLSNNSIDLEIKRGQDKNKNARYRIKNDELAQLIHSFVNQKPGLSRNSKNTLFSNNKIYNSIFKQKYMSDNNKKDFLVDLVILNDRYINLERLIKTSNDKYQFDKDQMDIFNNSKLTLFALFGVIYRLVNKDLSLNDLKDDRKLLETNDFYYGKFISEYKKDDIDEKLFQLIQFLVIFLQEEYDLQFKLAEVTSVSNFLKTDTKYVDDILKKILNNIAKPHYSKELFGDEGYSQLFVRK